jgi:hypothetical protein
MMIFLSNFIFKRVDNMFANRTQIFYQFSHKYGSHWQDRYSKSQ